MAIEVYLPQLLPWQHQLLSDPARYKVVACGRRAGKTTLARVWLADGVLPIERPNGKVEGYRCSYMAPTAKMADDTWRELKDMLAPVTIEKNEQKMFLAVRGGGLLEVWSLDNPEGPRGRKYHRVVIDEAAFIDLGPVWEKTVQPTTVDLKGQALFLSTPRGLNFFYRLFERGKEPDQDRYRSFRFPTTVNPIISEEDIDDIRRHVPAKIFAQEYEAAFISDAGQIFRNVDECAGLIHGGTGYKPIYEPDPLHTYFIGADFAKSEDFSVFTVLDANDRKMVWMERLQTVDYVLQTNALKALCARYRPIQVVAEKNAMGEAIIDSLIHAGINVLPFHTNSVSKAQLVQDLAFAFDAMTIKILDDEGLKMELRAYEGVQNKNGMLRFSAPDGEHDDMVMSLMLAYYGISSHATVESGYWRVRV